MEKLLKIVDEYCTFPMLEKIKLFKRTVFNFIVGNEDMHVKNFSVIRTDGKVCLSPAYDYLNTTSPFRLLGKSAAEIEEIALPLRGKKKNLTRNLLIDYFGKERAGLNRETIEGILEDFRQAVSTWKKLLRASFLSSEMKELYGELIEDRLSLLGLLKT